VRPSDFLLALPDRVREGLTDQRRALQWQQRWGLLKLWYHDPRIHYEVGFHRRIERLEVGLHFEADPATNRRLLEHFDANLIVAKIEISDRVEAEPWDRGWSRVYEMLPIEPLDDRYLRHVAGRTARLISVLEPLLEEAELSPRPS
jgi:hypothetical protein